MFVFKKGENNLTACSDIKQNVATSFSIMDLILPGSGSPGGVAGILNFNWLITVYKLLPV